MFLSMCVVSPDVKGLPRVKTCRTQDILERMFSHILIFFTVNGGNRKPKLSESSALQSLSFQLKLSGVELYPSLCQAVACPHAYPVVWVWRVLLFFCRALLLDCLLKIVSTLIIIMVLLCSAVIKLNTSEMSDETMLFLTELILSVK